MCGCSSGSKASGFSSLCGNKGSRLTYSMNKLTLMFNSEKDPIKREKLKEDRLTIDSILKEVAISGSCPDLATVVLIETEVNNEYTKYYNTW